MTINSKPSYLTTILRSGASSLAQPNRGITPSGLARQALQPVMTDSASPLSTPLSPSHPADLTRMRETVPDSTAQPDQSALEQKTIDAKETKDHLTQGEGKGKGKSAGDAFDQRETESRLTPASRREREEQGQPGSRSRGLPDTMPKSTDEPSGSANATFPSQHIKQSGERDSAAPGAGDKRAQDRSGGNELLPQKNSDESLQLWHIPRRSPSTPTLKEFLETKEEQESPAVNPSVAARPEARTHAQTSQPLGPESSQKSSTQESARLSLDQSNGRANQLSPAMKAQAQEPPDKTREAQATRPSDVMRIERKVGEPPAPQIAERLSNEVAHNQSIPHRNSGPSRLTINRLDIQIINQPPTPTIEPSPAPPQVSSQSSRGDMDRHFLGRFYLS